MERAVFENKPLKRQKAEAEQDEADRFHNFDKFQESLYKKFNNASLNKIVIPIKNSQRSLFGKSDDETIFDGKMSRTNLSSIQPNTRTLSTLDGALPSGTRSGASLGKKSRAEVKTFDVNGQTWTQIPSDKWKLVNKNEYGDEVKPETKLAELQLDNEAEQHFIEKLNRNIKVKRPVTSSSMHTTNSTKSTKSFVDIDSFFCKQVDNKIELDTTMKDKPKDFKM